MQAIDDVSDTVNRIIDYISFHRDIASLNSKSVDSREDCDHEIITNPKGRQLCIKCLAIDIQPL